MVPIPYALTYQATASGHAPKFVLCEKCGLEYVYFIAATGHGHGTSMLFLDNEGAKARSHAAAEAQVLATLEQLCAVVPCPACYHVQQHMVSQARSLRHRWMNQVAWCALVLLPVLCLVAWRIGADGAKHENETAVLASRWMWVAAALTGGSAIVLFSLRSILCRSYDPNAEPEADRKLQAFRRAMTQEEFVKAMQEVAPSEETPPRK